MTLEQWLHLLGKQRRPHRIDFLKLHVSVLLFSEATMVMLLSQSALFALFIINIVIFFRVLQSFPSLAKPECGRVF